MKKFEVTLYLHTNTTIMVEAKSESDAIEKARNTADKESLLANLQEDSAPDVKEIH